MNYTRILPTASTFYQYAYCTLLYTTVAADHTIKMLFKGPINPQN